MISVSKASENLLYRYTHLPLGGRKIRAPYWMDKIKKKIWGPYGGKGSPEELVEAANKIAKEKGINLSKLKMSQISLFLKKNRIGLDCSGLAFKLLDALDKEKGGNGLADDIAGARGRFLVRASVAMLTNNEVSAPVKKIVDLRVGDMIRLSGGRHLAVVTQIKKKGEAVWEITYAHSSTGTALDGVHTAKIIVRKENLGIEKQSWLEVTQKGENYGQKFFQPEKGDGVRRLKVWR